ncbi:McrB family protein [Actinomycetospora lemnae]|uniref:AAA family ATPase n=1 Tax=Actinomycetospora lemnae TaxID=3019891 RepID=A0ABT5SZZ7_9PSEU|nr:AAA family ATPase [Actinomycetospora sp. DW7H6]MDD7968437.1 AAA family ATPase [Actinomycetospora sp. DW7H6]
MASPSVGEVIDRVRDEFGPRFVLARVEAENEARRLLDVRAGRMTREEFVELGSAFNRHEVQGVVKLNRFSPAFTGYSILRAAERIDELNDAMRVLWGPSEPDALTLVGSVLQTRSELHGAGSSLLTMMMYLRDPERFGILINATMRGLRVATAADKPYSARSGEGYARFNDELLAWRRTWDVAPQEHDAILTALLRASREDGGETAPDPVVDPPGPLGTSPTAAPTTSADVARACHLPVETVDDWVGALMEGRLRQAFFHGPPGTGKTWVARHLAAHLASSPEHVRLVQFHPAFSYEDFVEGLRPEVDPGSGGLTYTVRPGLFRALCAEAAASPDERFVLVVDEMNRADLAAVFGELLLLLEYRGQTARLPYSQEPFGVPENLLLLGTMNTADRSLALVDFALRRRFHAFGLRPDREVLSHWLKAHDDPSDLPLRVFDLIAERVGADPAAPGHSYWMNSDDAATLERTWTFQVHPYLAELWFDRPNRLEELDREVGLLLGEGS